jgi:hypothetical protein
MGKTLFENEVNQLQFKDKVPNFFFTSKSAEKRKKF